MMLSSVDSTILESVHFGMLSSVDSTICLLESVHVHRTLCAHWHMQMLPLVDSTLLRAYWQTYMLSSVDSTICVSTIMQMLS